jgi:sugar lactone lactonase YvrE
VDLNSPWDLALSDDRRTLYVAMAGFHQIWALDLASGTISPYSGTGHEGLRDDVRSRAWHAQPSGLWLAGATLYVADSETSAVRAVETPGPAGRPSGRESARASSSVPPRVRDCGVDNSAGTLWHGVARYPSFSQSLCSS